MQYHAIAQLYSQDYCILFKIISFYNSIHFIFFLLNLFFLLIDIIVANNYCTNNYCIIVPYHYRSQFPDFITFLQNKNGLNSGCTSKIQHDWDKQWHDGYFSKEEGQGIVRAVHGRQYWKISPNGKVRKSYEGERARFPIGYQRFSKGCRAAYFLLPVNELLDIIEHCIDLTP